MSKEESAEFTCPKCGKPAEIENGYNTVVRCKDCGETRIIMSFLSNGDIETVTEDTKEYYELEPTVRKALKAVDEAGTDEEKADALNLLSDAYSATGREVKAEKIALEVLAILRSNIKTMRSRYYNQIPICAAFAIARGDYGDATAVYREGLESISGEKSIEIASMKVNYGILCTLKKDNYTADKIFKEAMEEAEGCFSKGEYGDDPYLLATIYDSMRASASRHNNQEDADAYANKALEERKRLLKDASVTSDKLMELVDAMGFVAENNLRKGNIDAADALMEEAIKITEKYDDHMDAYGYAILNRAKYRQTKSPEIPEGFLEDMDIVIPALESSKKKDKKMMENIAQAYMFRSMVRDPADFDNLIADLRGAYNNLLELAEMGDVNEMFFMSTAHSYLVLLNMKDKEKAQEVRDQLGALGISQADLDKATRGTIGNVNSKKTKVELLTSQMNKPIPGRRLRKQPRKQKE